MDAPTGKEYWHKRLEGNHDASPTEVSGRIYFSGLDGKTTILTVGREHEILVTNQLSGTFKASPTVADGAHFTRSDTHPYRMQEE